EWTGTPRIHCGAVSGLVAIIWNCGSQQRQANVARVGAKEESGLCRREWGRLERIGCAETINLLVNVRPIDGCRLAKGNRWQEEQR
ncbi:MAG: hypothetical protein WCD40_05060, partial [Candidatus Acidiferrales bacterium]